MPLNNSYDEQEVIKAIATALETFYANLIEKIDGLNIKKVMKRKNPYLYRIRSKSKPRIPQNHPKIFNRTGRRKISQNHGYGNKPIKNAIYDSTWNPFEKAPYIPSPAHTVYV